MSKLNVTDSNPGIAKNSEYNFSAQSIQTLLSSLSFGIIILQPIRQENQEVIDFKWIFCNKQAEEPFGRNLIGATSLELFPNSKSNGRFDGYKRALETGEPYTTEVEIKTDTHQIWIQLSASKLDDNLMLCISDISSQHALQESENRYRFLAESIPHIIYTCTPEGNIDYTNKKWLEYSGLSITLTVDYFLNNCVHPDEREKSINSWKEVINNPKEIKYTNRILGKDGKYRWFENRIVPLKDSKDTLVKWFGTCTDIHDVKLNLDTLRITKEALENKNSVLIRLNADLDTFVYTVSHDLTAPIANLKGLTDLLKNEMQYSLEASQIEYLDLMQKSIAKLQVTIFDLTRMIQIETDKDLKKVKIGFEAIYLGVVSDLQLQIRLSKASISCDFKVESILYAKKHLRTIIYNLLSNAIKYYSPDRKPIIHISTSFHDEDIVLTVSDNGMGIPANHVSKVFNIYNRLHPHIPGNGYGLYMLKRIVENNGGRIEVQSIFSEGASFNVYFT